MTLTASQPPGQGSASDNGSRRPATPSQTAPFNNYTCFTPFKRSIVCPLWTGNMLVIVHLLDVFRRAAEHIGQKKMKRDIFEDLPKFETWKSRLNLEKYLRFTFY